MDKPYPPVEYAEYLKLDRLLSSQSPKSLEYGRPAHDEMLFVIVHQAYELWFKQILHELDSVMALFRADSVDERSIGTAQGRLARVTEIQKLLVDQLRVLETMTPLDFLDFRDFLVPASGFQSLQFRLIETKLGLRAEHRALASSERQAALQEATTEPSLFALVERWLERTPFLETPGFPFWSSYGRAVDAMLAGDRATIESNPTLSDDDRRREIAALDRTAASFAAVLDEGTHSRLVAEGQRRCRGAPRRPPSSSISTGTSRFFTCPSSSSRPWSRWTSSWPPGATAIALMVHRMVGTKIGTGGSSGHQYLLGTVERNKIFSDLYNLSTFLISRSSLPVLPPEMERRLGFHYPRESP
jgi:tryptophan 2,3-dioxygenase